MRELANKHKNKLEEHKKMVEDWNLYFGKNNDRYWDYTKFVCATNLSSSDVATLNTLNKPAVQFNILEAMVSKLRSEFAKQEPSFQVRAADGIMPSMLTEEFIATLKVVEGYIRAIFDDSTNDGLQSNINTDQLVGGFSVVWIRTDYVNEYSFEQNIVVERVFDPTMTFFDPLARTSHKGDGQYCGTLIPYTKERFIIEYGEAAAKDIKFNRGDNLGGFNWSYQNQSEDIVLVAHMFEKKYKKRKIVMLSNGHVVPLENYKKLLEMWDDIAQPPIILDERETTEESIVCYEFCETCELAYRETDYKQLPLVFIDGNSMLIRGNDGNSNTGSGSGSGGATQQMTRPYVYHAKDAQRVMNFAGQTISAEIEQMVMHKWIVALEAIPKDDDNYLQAYQNPQLASVLVYNAFDDKTGQRLEGPREVQRTPTPPIVESTFLNARNTIQFTLGSYDSQQGIVGDNLSGKAIMQGAMQSDGTAGPYLINYIKGWNRIGEIVVDLIPKYYKTPRSLPVIDIDGKRRFQIVNAPKNEMQEQAQSREQMQQGETGRDFEDSQEQQSVSLEYDPNNLQIKIEAGVNSSVQKQKDLDILTRLMGNSEQFNAFMNTYGLEVLIGNLEINNVDSLQMLAAKYMQEQAQQAEEAAQQPDPATQELETLKEIEMAKVAQRQEQAEGDLTIKAANVAVAQEKNEIEYQKLLAEINEFEAKKAETAYRASAEDTKAAVDLAIEVAKMQHEMSSKDRNNQ
jgi:hypothetical protein